MDLVTKQGNWQFPKKGKNNFLFPVAAMNKLYKGFFLSQLKAAIEKGELQRNFYDDFVCTFCRTDLGKYGSMVFCPMPVNQNYCSKQDWHWEKN